MVTKERTSDKLFLIQANKDLA